MRDNQVMFYNTSVQEVMEILDMENRKDNALIELNEFEVKLNKKGDHTLITLNRSLDRGVSTVDGIIDLKIAFPGKYRDMESINRVKSLFRRKPESKWWVGVVEDLENGEPLSWKVEEIIIEREELAGKLNQAISMQPNNRFFQSLYDQFAKGYMLSERQVEVLDERLEQGRNDPRLPVNQLKRIDKALEVEPRSRFLKDLRKKSMGGSTLSDRQMAVVEKIIKKNDPPSISVGEPKDPALRLLMDLKRNAYSLEPSDVKAINKAMQNGIDSLTEDERKRFRHLIYRNQRKLQQSYTKDEVRRLLKKGSSMRKLSSRNRIKVLHHYIDPETNEPSVKNQFMTLKELVEELRSLEENRVEEVSDRVIFVGYGDFSGSQYSYTVKREDLFDLMLKENFKGLL